MGYQEIYQPGTHRVVTVISIAQGAVNELAGDTRFFRLHCFFVNKYVID